MPDLHKLLEQVNSRESFIAFVQALEHDWRKEKEIERQKPSTMQSDRGALGWVNDSIGDFLESAGAWAEDNNAFPSQPSWRALAEFLYAGKIYE